jgi:hypothetical protein
LFIDPNARRHIDHVVEARHDVLFVNQHEIFGLAVFDPGQRGFDAAGVFGDGDDFKVLIFEFAVNFLPT